AAAQALGVAAPRAGEHLSAEGRAWLPARLRLRLGLKLDVNQASTEDLQAISGIGPSTAARIIAARPFSRLAELRRAHGVGPKRLARWRASLQLGPPPLISLSAGRRSE
ncbi:helix-hairpin-helix domain-containing protein, partial [Myxococcota bacterium]|nr:helix-hairpin-helix domain-containing protein [Myxococcota bacterium]